MMRNIIFAFLLIDSSLSAATLYVDPTNSVASDVNPGTLLLPWKTLAQAESTAVAGDTVIVQPSTNHVSLAVTTSGSAGNPITFTGVRGPSGEWLTIIDPSVQITNWTLAAEGSNGVYKASTGLTQPITELIIGPSFRKAPFVYTTESIVANVGSVFTNSGLTTGLQLLSTPQNTVFGGAHGLITNLWSILGVCFASTGSVCYIRFPGGTDPNTLEIRGLDNSGASTEANNINKEAISCTANHVVFSNFWLRGAPGGIKLSSTASYNTIISNYITGCFEAVQFYAYPSNNIVQFNVTDGYRYGMNGSGAWSRGGAAFNDIDIGREFTYEWCKYLEGQTSVYQNSMEIYYGGSSNLISGNLFTNTWGNGLSIAGPPTDAARSTIITNNLFANHPSAAVIDQFSHIYTLAVDNKFVDSNANWRNAENRPDVAETNRSVYLYRNTSWLPNSVGDHIFVNMQETNTFFTTHWVYQNSFCGGRAFVTTSTSAPAFGYLPNHHFINNVLSSMYQWWGFALGWNTNASYVGDFTYNLLTTNANTTSSSAVAWFGTNNIQISTDTWSNAFGMSFVLPLGSLAINAAIDTTTSFTLQGNSYSALPQDGTVKVGSAWDIGALEFTPPVTNTPVMTVNQLNVGQAIFY